MNINARSLIFFSTTCSSIDEEARGRSYRKYLKPGIVPGYAQLRGGGCK